MNHKQLLIDREYNLTEGKVNWYSSLKKLREYSSVKIADIYDTTSGAGDWNGYIVQRIGNTNYLIFFWQENNWPSYGFTVYTESHVSASWKGDLDRATVEAIVGDILQEE